MALLVVPSMVLERVVAIQMENFFEDNNLLGDFQFGFRRGKSTVSELIQLMDTLMEAKLDKKEICLILYDLSSAFDTVSPKVLIEKLKLYGFNSNAMSWISSYLSGRKQAVTINGEVSEPIELTLGTPQGSRLSPLLFLILMSDLNLHTDKSSLTNYADDTQSCIISNTKEETMKIAQDESNSVVNFFKGVNLVNNPTKACILYNSKGREETLTIENIGGVTLTSKSSEKLLGLNVAANLTWDTHTEKLCIKLKQRLGMLKRIKRKIGRNKLKIIAEAILTSRIRYGLAVYGNPKFDFRSQEQSMDPNLQKLQVIQNDMIRLLNNYRRTDHIEMKTLREKMNIMSVNQLCVYHVALEMFNIVVNSSAERVKEKLILEENPSYQLRNRRNGEVRVPFKPAKPYFSYTGPKLFNFLPEELRKNTSPKSFKVQLKQWIWDNVPSV